MQDLGLVGIRDMRSYDANQTYMKGHHFLYDGSTYLVLQDNVRGITPSNDGVYYRYLARGFDAADAEDITVTDTEGVIVAAGEKTLMQTIIDYIVDHLSAGTAADTTYDNTDSGLTATNVQDAIDEVDDAVDTLGSAAVKKADLSSSGTVTTAKQYAADAWQLNPDNTGSYAAGVNSQIESLSNSIDGLTNNAIRILNIASTAATGTTVAAYSSVDIDTGVKAIGTPITYAGRYGGNPKAVITNIWTGSNGNVYLTSFNPTNATITLQSVAATEFYTV